MDTVQVEGMTIEPFQPTIRGERLYGRGATDAKGSLASMMTALCSLATGSERPECDVYLVAAMDEEHHYRGVAHLIDSGFQADGGVVGEPTSAQVVTACKGCIRWRVEVRGRAAHTSRPHEGINAVEGASRLIVHLEDELDPQLQARAHPLVGPPTLCASLIEGGIGVNTVPDRCMITFDRRVIPGETADFVLHEFNEAIATVSAAHPQFQFTVHPPFITDIPMEVPPETDIVRAARQATQHVLGSDDFLGVAFGCDASKMTDSGIPTIVFGPGSIEHAHAADEFIEIADLPKAIFTLCELALRF